MSNTLTDIASALYAGANIVAQEPCGFIDAVKTDFSDKKVALNETVKVPYSGAATVANYTPAMTTTAGTDSTAASVSVTISNSKQTSHNLTGEEMLALENAGVDKIWTTDKIAEMCRALRNAHEAEIFTSLYKEAFQGHGTAGTNPFASNIDELADVKKKLIDRGCPQSDLQCVIDSTSYANLLKMDLIQQSQQAGSSDMRNTGILNNFFGFQIRTSGQISVHTAGDEDGAYVLNGAAAAGDTTIALDTGTGSFLAGDAVNFQDDTAHTYIVKTGIAAAGDLVISRPGLLAALTDGHTAINTANYTPNPCFHRGAVVSVNRAPIIPENANIKQMIITDVMGYSYLLCQIAGDGMITWRMHLVYGTKVIVPAFIVNLLG